MRSAGMSLIYVGTFHSLPFKAVSYDFFLAIPSRAAVDTPLCVCTICCLASVACCNDCANVFSEAGWRKSCFYRLVKLPRFLGCSVPLTADFGRGEHRGRQSTRYESAKNSPLLAPWGSFLER